MGSIFFIQADEGQLNDLLMGRPSGDALPWTGGNAPVRLRPGSVGVVFRHLEPSRIVQPLAIVAKEEDHRRLFGRFAQLRSDLSPITSWCHIISPRRFESLGALTRDADLSGLEAPWIGLTIAESLLLADRALPRLRIAACLATQTFAVARTAALWGPTSMEETTEKHAAAQRLVRQSDSRSARLTPILEPIWATLRGLAGGEPIRGELRPLVQGLRALVEARQEKDVDEARFLADPLIPYVPKAVFFGDLLSLTPEQRVREFDNLLSLLEGSAHGKSQIEHQCTALLAGYLATVAAGGIPSISLAEQTAARWPEVVAWAYAVGSIGERVVWSSAFDGLGRLVARELTRPFRIDDAPNYDFALDEAAVLVDPQLSDPLVHLRIKQSRVVTVSILPGVSVAAPLASEVGQEVRIAQPQQNEDRTTSDPLPALARALWPYLRAYMEGSRGAPRSQRPRGKRTSSQSKLPLDETSKK